MPVELLAVVVHKRNLTRVGTVVHLSPDGTGALVEYGVGEGTPSVEEAAVLDLLVVERFVDVPEAGLRRVPVLSLNAFSLVMPEELDGDR